MYYLILTLIGLMSASSIAMDDTSVSAGSTTDPYANSGYWQTPIPADENCSDLKVGESHIVDIDETDTLVSRKYKVTRLRGDKLFQIDMNLELVPTYEAIWERMNATAAPGYNQRLFPPSSDLSKPGEKHNHWSESLQDELRARIFGRIQQCVQEKEPFLKSPDGTRIKLRVHAAGTNQSNAPNARIELQDAGYRDGRNNMGNWTSTIDCPTIIHELSHYLGLCDGYHENLDESGWAQAWRGLRNLFVGREHEKDGSKFVCRSYEPKEGVMYHQHWALGGSHETLTCKRIPNQTIVSAMKDRNGDFFHLNSPALMIPVNSIPRKCPHSFMKTTKTHIVKVYPYYEDPEYNGMIFYYKKAPQYTDAYTDGQMRFITKPFCVSETRQYRTCMENAYVKEKSKCKNVPPYCQDQSHLD